MTDRIITEKTRSTFEFVGSKPKGSEMWLAWPEGSHITVSGWTEAEAIANLNERLTSNCQIGGAA